MLQADISRTGAYYSKNFERFSTIKWEHTENFGRIGCPTLVIDQDFVYSIYFNGYLAVIDLDQGYKAWGLQLDIGSARDVILSEDIAYIAGTNGTICALDLKSREIKWFIRLSRATVSGILVFDEKLCVSSNDGFLYTLNCNTGQLLWSFKTTSGMRISMPSIKKDKIFISSRDGKLYSVDKQTGEQVWKHEIGPVDTVSCPTVIGEFIYILNKEGTFNQIEANTGERIHNYSLPPAIRSFDPPSIADHYLCFASPVGVCVFDLNSGQEIWKRSDKTFFFAKTLAVNETLLVIGTGQILAFDLETGKTLWSFEVPPPKGWQFKPKLWRAQLTNLVKKTITGTTFTELSIPVVNDQTMFVGTSESRIFALE